ncbi:MAG TPA: hypothetical protein VFV30_00545, partial [Novosphingobium sp.]|nr:hypothetical protein [Novosphingobium sp.]
MGREVKSKILDGINDLVIMAPIREGFIDAYEPVTYATRLRIICEALNDIRAAAREYEKDVPFADASERILSLLDFKAGIIDNDLLQLQPGMGLSARRYFYLIATFDGVWEPYMRLIWNPLGSLLDLLFANCDGYVFACDNSFEDYINWVRSAQVDSAVFFTTTGVTVADQLYLRNLEKLHRESEPAAGDLAITRMAVRNPGDVAGEWREASLGNTFAAHRLALEALGVFYRLADYYPPLPAEVLDHIGDVYRADGYLLQRAMHRILDGWRHESLQPLLADGGILARFRPLVEWFASGPIHPDFASQQRPVAEPVLDHSQIQRGILSEPKLP